MADDKLPLYGTYAPLPEGAKEYRKIATVQAVKMEEPFRVRTLAGIHQGIPGDWLVKNHTGELYMIAGVIFERTYAPAFSPA